ncbi:MAG: hypothetical protein RLZZ292_1941 [Bacteroidota bacterium]|jgi:hypothetical protein
MTNRLDILENSLKKKEEVLANRLTNHFNFVKSANGQPMNDKRNGADFFKAQDKQNDAIRNASNGVDKTKVAIEREEKAIKRVNSIELPIIITEALEAGEIMQWRKFPHIFFVAGVEKGRIIYNKKTKDLFCSHYSEIPTKEQKDKFKNFVLKLVDKLSCSFHSK